MFSCRSRRTPMPPLSANLRDFPESLCSGCSFGEVRGAAYSSARTCFPECSPTRSFLPESFRGGCSFGAGIASGDPVSPAVAITLTTSRPKSQCGTARRTHS